MTAAPAVTLRPTEAHDLPAVTAWERHPDNSAFVEVWPSERHQAALTDPAMVHMMVETEGDPVGFVILAGLGSARPVVEFRRIVVADKGRGVGQAAVARVVRYAFEDLEAAEVWLDFAVHNTRAAHVYSKCGFRIDPSADMWAEIDGKRTRLVKMTTTRAGTPDGTDRTATGTHS
jgi:RimJ/RimL family protein N-acetyltransferase